MDNKETILMDIGLSKNEAKAYAALIELGPSTVTKISDRSKVHRTNLYEALERLKKKGIVTSYTKKGTIHFEANDPAIFKSLIREKEAKLDTLLPQLELAKRLATPSENVEIREGLAGVKLTYEEVLKHNKPIYTFGSKAASEVAKIFLNRFHKKRIAMKIPMYHIYDSDAEERIKEIKKFPHTPVRTLPPGISSPLSTAICGDEVSFKIWDAKEGMAIVIRSPRIAKAYKQYFDLMWDMAKPT